VSAEPLPIEAHRISRPPPHIDIPRACVYRYATETDRDRHLVEEARILRERPFR
jgi:hypothetical protein